MAGAQFVVLALKLFRLSGGGHVELQASSGCSRRRFGARLIARGVLLALGAIALPLFTSSHPLFGVRSALALAGEIIGRYLFFVSAVPKHLAAPYLGSEAA